MQLPNKLGNFIKDVAFGVVSTDVKGEIIYINEEFERLFDYTKDELIGKNISLLMPDDPASKHDGYIKRYLEHGTSKIVGQGRDLIAKKRNGELFPCYIAVSRHESEEGIRFVAMIHDLSAQHRVLRDVHTAHEIYKTIADDIPIAICFLSEQGDIEYGNSKFSELFNIKMGELKDKSLFDYLDVNNADSLHTALKMNIKGEDATFHTLINSKEKSLRFECRSKPIFQEGLLDTLIVTFKDISKEAELSKKLDRSEQVLSYLTDSLKQVLWMCVPDGRKVIHVTKAYEDTWGLSSEDLYADGHNWLTPIVEEDKEEVFQAFSNISHKDYDQEFRIKRPDGSLRWVHDTGHAVKNQEGVTEFLVGMAEDITDKKNTELALSESLEKFKALSELSPSGIFQTDSTGKFTYANPHLLTLIGITHEEFTSPNWVKVIHPEDLKLVLDHSNDLLVSHTPFSLRFRIVNPVTQQELWLLGSTKAVKNQQGEVTSYLGVVTDITLIQQAEQDLARSKVLAEQANKAKSLFLANMSHEIRTPLNVISGFSQLIKMQADNEGIPENFIQYARHISSAGEHLQKLIDDILDLSKIEAGRLELNIVPTNLHELIEKVTSMLKANALKEGVNFVYNISENTPRVIETDQTRFSQIIINLVQNAIKFTDNGKNVTLSIRLDKSDCVEISVNDEGIGIETEELDKIFSSFSQANKSISPNYGGSGLGLAITQQLTRLLNGKIFVNSTLGKGSTFTVVLPVKINLTSNNEPNIDNANFNHEINVLVVEDNQQNRTIITAMLEGLGMKVQSVTNAKDGIRFAQENMPDVVLMDIHMPGMDGIEATQAIHSNDSLSKLPIIAVSANSLSEIKEKALSAGMCDYLTKPLDVQQLENCIKKHIQRLS